MATLGSTNYYSALASGANIGSFFDDTFAGKEGDPEKILVRESEFYAACFNKALTAVGNLKAGAVGSIITLDDSFKSEALNLTETKRWLFEQQMSDRLVGLICAAIIPKFFYNVFDLLNRGDVSYEENEFTWKYSRAVIIPIIKASFDSAASTELKMQMTMCRWWLIYTIDMLDPVIKAHAMDFVNRMQTKGGRPEYARLAIKDSVEKFMYSIKASVRKHMFETISEGTGFAIYNHIKKYLDEKVMVRRAFSNAARIELKLIQDQVGVSHSIIITDQSKWFKHTRRIADSMGHQMYSINSNGILVPELETREIASFITDQIMFATEIDTPVTKNTTDFINDGLRHDEWIDVSRISSYINENGMNVPNVIDQLSVMYSAALKDSWFSINSSTVLGDNISALDLKFKMDSLHLVKGTALKLFGELIEMNQAITGELALILTQRVFAMILPETSATGSLQMSYDNVFGTPIIRDGQDAEAWFYNDTVTGLVETSYQNVIPIVSFLESLNIREYSMDRMKEKYVGEKLLASMHYIFKNFGLEELKAKILPTAYKGALVDLPGKNVYTEWTSAAGQAHHKERMNTYGNLIKERFLFKSLFEQSSSSGLNEALVKCLSILISYKTSAINPSNIFEERKA